MSEKKSGSGSENRIKSVENVFTIIESLCDQGWCGVSELARTLNIPKSTAHVYLTSLRDAGYVVKESDEYHLSLRFLQLGGRIRHTRSVYQAARPEVDELARSTGEVGTIGYEEDDRRVLVYRSEPAEGVSDNAPTGEFTRMHWTALGKVLLAQRPDDEVRGFVDRYGLPSATDNTITGIDSLLEELDTTREQGYSVEDEERVKGAKSIAIAINGGGPGPGKSGISIAGPKHRFTPERVENELLPELRNAANVIRLKYKHY